MRPTFGNHEEAVRPIRVVLSKTSLASTELYSDGHLSSDQGEGAVEDTQPSERSQGAARPGQGPIEKQIDVIIEGPTYEGVSTSGQRAYTWAIVEKRPAKPMGPISPSKQATLNTLTMMTR
ncbi:hypothetical protein B296_00027456 [Ensete ventricosum]|uniref:Uncharacterized protein n=1 Tax=Ensete ventricosum TaxID=4639 RepID=A0A427APP2_ENSVE|nr:hypothetical protein B296_00027456 [Ensete ventricosum]